MTALATIFALTPMALGITGHGGFISQPLAIVVIGGLISSTVLTLLVLPTLYNLVEGAKERRAARRAGGTDAAPVGDGDGPRDGGPAVARRRAHALGAGEADPSVPQGPRRGLIPTNEPKARCVTRRAGLSASVSATARCAGRSRPGTG